MNRITATMIAYNAATALDGANLDGTISLDADQALQAVTSGHNVFLLLPPTITYTTFHDAEAEWTAYLIPGTSDRDTAWQILDDLLEALRAPLELDTATPYDWRPDTGGQPLPAYQLQFTTNHEL